MSSLMYAPVSKDNGFQDRTVNEYTNRPTSSTPGRVLTDICSNLEGAVARTEDDRRCLGLDINSNDPAHCSNLHRF